MFLNLFEFIFNIFFYYDQYIRFILQSNYLIIDCNFSSTFVVHVLHKEIFNNDKKC